METRRGPSAFEWGCLGLALVAVAARVPALFSPQSTIDSAWYLGLARSFAREGAFVAPWASPDAVCHWSPVYPVFAAPFVAVLGPHFSSLVVASTTAFVALLAVVWLATRDLYGRGPAFAALAVTAASPIFLLADRQGMSESLVALVFALTAWALVKSLRDDRWLPAAALFAFVAYLTRAGVGIAFLVAAFVGFFAWRVAKRGWARVLGSPIDVGLAAAGILVIGLLAFQASGSCALGAVGRGGLKNASGALDAPLVLAAVFALKVLFLALLLLLVTLPLSMRVGDALSRPREEGAGVLWAFAIVTLLAGAFFAASYFITEKRRFVDIDNLRYLAPSSVVFAMLLAPRWHAKEAQRPAARAPRAWLACAGLALFVLVALAFPAAVAVQAPDALAYVGLLAVALLLALPPLLHRLKAPPEGRRSAPSLVTRLTSGPNAVLAIAAVGVLAFGLLLGWLVATLLGALVGLALASPRARVLAVGLALLATMAPIQSGDVETLDALDADLAKLPPGSTVGVLGLAAVVAAQAPPGIVVTQLDAEPGPELAAFVTMGAAGAPLEALNVTGFVHAGTYETRVVDYPTVRLAHSLAARVTGAPAAEEMRGLRLGLYLRANATG